MEKPAEIERLIIEKLKGSGLIDKFSLDEFTVTPNIELLMDLMNRPSEIFSDDYGIFYIDDQGEQKYCPEFHTTVTEQGEWISQLLPNAEFDIFQNGNVRKAREAESLYCVIIVANVLKGDIYRDKFLEVCNGYDYNNMLPNPETNKTFKALLAEFVSWNSAAIKILVSASKYKLADTKKNTEKFLKDGISEEQAIELRNLEVKVKNINIEYSETTLSRENIKKMTKIGRLTQITKRDDEISKAIANSKEGILYKLLNLSSEYITPEKKKKIENFVINELEQLFITEKFKNLQEDRIPLMKKLMSSAFSYEKNSIRKYHIEKYISDPINFRFPAKQ